MSKRPVNNLIGPVCCLLVLSAGLHAAALPPQNLLSHGAGEFYWIAQVQTRRIGEKTDEFTIIRGRQIGGDVRWPEIGRVPARVVSLANRGSELAVLLENGDWMLIWRGGSAMGRSPQDGARIVTLGGGLTSTWAVAVGGRAQPTTDESLATAPAAEPGAPALYLLQAGQFDRIAPLPSQLTASPPQAMSLAVVEGDPVLAVLGEDAQVRIARWREQRWESLGQVDATDAAQMKLIGGSVAPTIWLAPAAGAGALHLYQDGAWSPPKALAIADHVPRAPDRTLAHAQNLRLAFVQDAKLVEQAFGPAGQPIGSPTVLPTLQPSAEPPAMRWLTTAAAAMLMMVVIGSIRRPELPDTVPGVTLAPLSYRFMAGMIDALPLAVATVLLSRDVPNPEPTVEELMAAVGYPFYISLGIYFLHTWLSEQLFSRTIGKFIFGLRVVTVAGVRPGAGAIFIRNILRLVDVMIMIPLVLVLFSPLKQRVGDVAARTIVVMDAAVSKPSDDAAAEK